jgi:integrase
MPNRLRTFRGQIAATGLFCACQRHGGRSYAQKEQKATLPQDRSQAPRSRSREISGTQQPEFAPFEEELQVRHGAVAPHDFRRTCAKLCHGNGGELEQIQFLLGHVSVLTTERYLGCKQNLEEPVNDRFGCLFARASLDVR